MDRILIIGAGRSTSVLIRYLLEQSAIHGWSLTVADADERVAQAKVAAHPNGRAISLDANDDDARRKQILNHDLVISMLPPSLHAKIEFDCLEYNRHLATASYVSAQMYNLAEQAKARSLIFMGELGLDPGIDHMSAASRIRDVRMRGGEIKAFRSFTGGLIAPQSNDNPWGYKFTWNPKNVIRAGQGTAQYLEDGQYKYIPYNQLFRRFRLVDIIGVGQFEMYANRDSLLYREKYNLEDVPTMIRGTLRYPGFCEAWNALVQLGLTDASYPILNSHEITYRGFLEGYVDGDSASSLEEKVARAAGIHPEGDVITKLGWLGLFEDRPINLQLASPAAILEQILLEKWKLEDDDKDLIVMQHEIDYELDGRMYRAYSTLHLEGENSRDTAMAQLVGLPLGVFVKYVMSGKIHEPGVHIPVYPVFYEPILKELSDLGIRFRESQELISQ